MKKDIEKTKTGNNGKGSVQRRRKTDEPKPLRFANSWKNRIIRTEEMKVSDLIANPMNWRKHPKSQSDALKGVIGKIGIIQSLIFNERTGRLIDGHLRVELARENHESTLPVNIVDLSEEEEKEALLTLDPITMMAEADRERLKSLMESVRFEDERVHKMIDDLASTYFIEGISGMNSELFSSEREVGDTQVVCPNCGAKFNKHNMDRDRGKRAFKGEVT